MKKLLSLIGVLLLLCNNVLGQYCQLSYEQQEAVDQAKRSISAANKNPSYDTYTDLVNKCSKALELVPDCPDTYNFYKELITTYRDLTKSRDANELYFYERAINECNKYLLIITDPIQRDTYTALLKELNIDYQDRKVLREKSRIRIKDDEAFEFAKRFSSIESYRGYLDAFPYGLHASEAKQKLDLLINEKFKREDSQAFSYAKALNTKESYSDYIIKYSNGYHVFEAQENVKIIEEKELWPKIIHSNDIAIFENYLKEFSNGAHTNDVKQILSELYIKKGDSEVAKGDHNSGLSSYYKAQNYYSFDDLSKKIQQEEDIVLFEKIQTHKRIEDCALYLNSYPNGDFRKEVSLIACPLYFKKAKENEEAKNWNSAIDIYSRIQQISYLPNEKKEANSRISSIRRKIEWEKTKKNLNVWNNGCDESRFFYTYILNQPSAEGADNMNGISAYSLKNNGFGKYLSFRASNSFFSSKEDSTNLEKDRYSFQYEDKEKISSALLSFGLTKKIFRPVFAFAGIGIGTNLSSKKYMVMDTKLNDDRTYWLYDEGNRSWYLNPEFGIMIGSIPKLSWLSIFGGIGFPIPLTNKELFDYKSTTFSCGIGISFDDIVKAPKSNVYLAYNFDIPNPSNLEFASNSSLFGFSIGSLGIQDSPHGMYGSIRANKLFFQQKASKDSNTGNNGGREKTLRSSESEDAPSEAEYNYLEKGNLFATIGYSVRVFKPVSIYLGGGVAWQKELDTDIDSKDYNLIVEKIRFNPEIGINYSISHFLVRGGINAPNFETKNNNLYYSLGVGYIW